MRGAAVGLTVLLLTSIGWSEAPPSAWRPDCADPEDCRLWEAGRIAGIRVGGHGETVGHEGFSILAREFNLVSNHGASWSAFQPTPDTTTGSLDFMCDFAKNNGMDQFAFHYAWDNLVLDDLADWVLDVTDPSDLRQVLRERVRLLFEACPTLDRINVVNEPFIPGDGSALFPNHFFQVLGPDYIAELFRIVDEEAPDGVELVLNENFVEYFPGRAAALVDLVRSLVEAGAPIDFVGMQGHLFTGEPDWELYRNTLNELADLGVGVFLSELDVPVGPEVPDRYAVQAERYRRAVETCLAVPACDSILIWGIDDDHSWLNSFTLLSGPDPDPLLFDGDFQPKPAYFAVRDALLRGRAGEHPVRGDQLIVKAGAGGVGSLSLRSFDPRVVSPSPGSANDPAMGDPGGAIVEILFPDGRRRTIELPRENGGDSFDVGPGKLRFDSETGPLSRLRMLEGRKLRLDLTAPGLTPDDFAAGAALRITLGTLRTCLWFGPETTTFAGPRKWSAAAAPRLSSPDCSDSALAP